MCVWTFYFGISIFENQFKFERMKAKNFCTLFFVCFLNEMKCFFSSNNTRHWHRSQSNTDNSKTTLDDFIRLSKQTIDWLTQMEMIFEAEIYCVCVCFFGFFFCCQTVSTNKALKVCEVLWEKSCGKIGDWNERVEVLIIQKKNNFAMLYWLLRNGDLQSK